MNTPSWSLSCEALFYLVFPALWFALRGAGPRSLGIAAVVMIAVIWTCLRSPWPCPRTRRIGLSGSSPWRACLSSSSASAPRGWCPKDLGRGYPRRWRGSHSSPRTLRLPLGRWGFVAVTSIPLVFLIAATARRDMDGERSFWRARPLVTLGTWSFAFYLVHQIVIRFAGSSGHSPLVGTLWALALLVAALAAVAGSTHALVEVPGMARASTAAAGSGKSEQVPLTRGRGPCEAPQPAVSPSPERSRSTRRRPTARGLRTNDAVEVRARCRRPVKLGREVRILVVANHSLWGPRGECPIPRGPAQPRSPRRSP